MNTNPFQIVSRAVRGVLLLALGTMAVFCSSVPQLDAADSETLMRKVCEKCGRTVGRAARRGQACPHCGAYWADERTMSQAIPIDSPRPSVAAPSAHSRGSMSLKQSSRKTWPKLPHQVLGRHQLIIDNHTSTDISIGLRDGANGADMKVSAQGKGYLSLPEGTYRAYVFRHDQPTSLYEAGSVKLGGKNVIRSSQTFCLWFDEADPVDKIDPATGLHTVAAR